MSPKDLIGRVYFYTKLGWGNYIAWWLGAIAYITIIYELVLKNLFPASPLAYVFIFLGLLAGSFLLGYGMKRIRLFSVESAINTEVNPYINVPIGRKEILSYRIQIQNIDMSIVSTGAIMELVKGKPKLVARLRHNITIMEGQKRLLQELLGKAKA